MQKHRREGKSTLPRTVPLGVTDTEDAHSERMAEKGHELETVPGRTAL